MAAVISPIFFPSADPVASLLATLAVFAFKSRIGEGKEHERQSDGSENGDGAAGGDGEQGEQRRNGTDGPQCVSRNERRKADRKN